MTIARSLAKWMEDNGFGTFGTDLFVGSVPLNAVDPSWWILGGGGAPVIRNRTGEKVKQYIFNVLYRNTDSEDVDTQLQSFEEFVNSKECHSIDDYETVDMEATGFQSDQDVDAEERTVGSVEITITTYQS